MARKKKPTEPAIPDLSSGLQSGGSRGSSNQGGPESSARPEKDGAVRINNQHDRGSRSTEGRRDPEERTGGEDVIGRSAEPPRGPLPEGAQPEDYLGGEEPHKTRTEGATQGASGVKNEVV
jgi:hypothetical protein